jgi:hypothetical protein
MSDQIKRAEIIDELVNFFCENWVETAEARINEFYGERHFVDEDELIQAAENQQEFKEVLLQIDALVQHFGFQQSES